MCSVETDKCINTVATVQPVVEALKTGPLPAGILAESHYSRCTLCVHSPTQLSHRLQWEARGGRKILQVKQYFSFTVWPLMMTSLVLGGGRYPPELVPLAISVEGRKKKEHTPSECHFGSVVPVTRLGTWSSCGWYPRAAVTLACSVLSGTTGA